MTNRRKEFHSKLKRSRWKNIPTGEKVSQTEWDRIFGKKEKEKVK